MAIKLISITPDAEAIMAYCARVSSPNQENPVYANLLNYCVKHKHWSVFEMADMCIEITTSRAIAAQILRHSSFHFQEFSQRYATISDDDVCIYKGRAQDLKNRQNSLDTIPDDLNEDWENIQRRLWQDAKEAYQWALDNGFAKECARMVLPLQTKTKMYMKGTIRDWIHYINLRSNSDTQLEHREIALQIKQLFSEQLPTVATAVWSLTNDKNNS